MCNGNEILQVSVHQFFLYQWVGSDHLYHEVRLKPKTKGNICRLTRSLLCTRTCSQRSWMKFVRGELCLVPNSRLKPLWFRCVHTSTVETEIGKIIIAWTIQSARSTARFHFQGCRCFPGKSRQSSRFSYTAPWRATCSKEVVGVRGGKTDVSVNNFGQLEAVLGDLTHLEITDPVTARVCMRQTTGAGRGLTDFFYYYQFLFVGCWWLTSTILMVIVSSRLQTFVSCSEAIPNTYRCHQVAITGNSTNSLI